MPREFKVPEYYRSNIVSELKERRNQLDPRKKDLVPTELDLGPVRFRLARHFGFCFGVQNAIEIAYRAVEENPDNRVFLLSEMIHNPHVNSDLAARGVQFLMSPEGKQLIPLEELNCDDIVIVPAFGTTVELMQRIQERGIDPRVYNTTCPFVERVWKRAAQLGEEGVTIVIHGKPSHEETRATFSHASLSGPSIVVRDRSEALLLVEYVRGKRPPELFSEDFKGRASPGFDIKRDLKRIGVVNQTTMLAEETREIAQLLRLAMLERYGEEQIESHFADTRDTLCYATTENQSGVRALIEAGGDLAIVVGGYNSSNTSHLVEILGHSVPVYYIKDEGEILSCNRIRHLDLKSRQVVESLDWLGERGEKRTVLVTAGASCPDALVDRVLCRVAELFGVLEVLESRKYEEG